MKIKKKKYTLFALVCTVLLSLCALLCGCGGNGDEKPPEKEVASVVLDTTNADLVFDVGDEFTANGLLVKAIHTDGSETPVFAADCTLSAPDMAQRGVKTVTVAYAEKTAEYQITVREIESIGVNVSGAKTQFLPDEEFEYTGLIVTAHYYDGVPDSVIAVGDYTVTAPEDMTAIGNKTVRVEYKGKTCEYTINVDSPKSLEITSAAIEKEGDKVYYVVSGTYEGNYTANDFTLDVQVTSGSWGTTTLTTTATLESGTFRLKGDISSIGAGRFISHLKIANEESARDLANLSAVTENEIVSGARTLRIGKEDVFANGTQYVVINCELDASYQVTGATLDVRGDKVYYVLTGTFAGYTAEDFAVDIQETHTQFWDTKKIDDVIVTLNEDGTFEVAANVTGISENINYISHFIVSGTQHDVLNLVSQDYSVELGGKTYTIFGYDLWSNGTVYVAIKVN